MFMSFVHYLITVLDGIALLMEVNSSDYKVSRKKSDTDCIVSNSSRYEGDFQDNLIGESCSSH